MCDVTRLKRVDSESGSSPSSHLQTLEYSIGVQTTFYYAIKRSTLEVWMFLLLLCSQNHLSYSDFALRMKLASIGALKTKNAISYFG